jgi:hypothetical protein
MPEMPLDASPSSRVPVIYRWDMDTFDQAINGGDNPVYNTIWTAGGDQMGTMLTSLTNDPKATDSDSIADSAAGSLAGSDAGNPVPHPAPAGDGSGDSGSDSGCLSCEGILRRLCS